MNKIIRNILAVLLGFMTGSIVNMGIIMISGTVIPPPEGIDVTTSEGLNRGLHLFQPKHYLFPFLAHALGTLTGSVVTTKIARPQKYFFPLLIGTIFLLGGISNIFVLKGGAAWFYVVDILLAYIPMSYLGYMLGKK